MQKYKLFITFEIFFKIMWIVIFTIVVVIIGILIVKNKKSSRQDDLPEDLYLDKKEDFQEKQSPIHFKPAGQNSPVNFVAIDFETANAKRSSICAIGIVIIENLQIKSSHSWLVRPKELIFHPLNVHKHHIDEHKIKNEPEFNIIWKKLHPLLEGKILVAHNAPFDMSVLRSTLDIYNIEYPNSHYLCTLELAKKEWPDLKSYRLKHLAEHFKIELKHHNPESDARCSANILLKLIDYRKSKKTRNFWKAMPLIKPKKTGKQKFMDIKKADLSKIEVSKIGTINTQTFFKDKSFVITGLFDKIDRENLKNKIIELEGRCPTSVSSRTNYIIMGREPGWAKIDKVRQLIKDGNDIKIFNEEEILKCFK